MSDTVASDSKIKYEGDTTQDIPVNVHRPKRKNEEAPRHSLRDSANDLLKEERFWATLAHALGPIMMGMWLFTDGPWVLAMVFTAGIWLYHRNSAPMVAYHARQALALQVMGTFGWLFLVATGAVMWSILLVVSLVLILVLIGLILAPVVFVGGIMAFFASLLLPLSVIVLGTIGAWETWNGRDYRYPYLADWLDRMAQRGAKPAARDLVVV